MKTRIVLEIDSKDDDLFVVKESFGSVRVISVERKGQK